MEKYIDIRVNGKDCQVPNSWEVLTTAHYLKLVNYLSRMEHGDLSPAEVRIYFLCDLLGVDVHRLKNEQALENIVALSEQLTFIFRIVYPDDNAALKDLSSEEYRMCQRIDPSRLSYPYAKDLMKLDYKYTVDLCFCRQMMPVVFVDKKPYSGYEVNLEFNTLTCSLKALQYIEARQLLDLGEESLPLLAAILYYPGEYSSEGAQKLARDFRRLPKSQLNAIALNFLAVNNFIFTRTPFSLLTKFVADKSKPITIDASDALYDLSKDGLGNVLQVERMNVITYLRILRKKTIEGVKGLKASGMDVVKISNEVGLPLSIVKQII